MEPLGRKAIDQGNSNGPATCTAVRSAGSSGSRISSSYSVIRARAASKGKEANNASTAKRPNNGVSFISDISFSVDQCLFQVRSQHFDGVKRKVARVVSKALANRAGSVKVVPARFI